MDPIISEVGAGNGSNLWTYNSTIDGLLTLKDDGLLGHTTALSSEDRGICKSFLALGISMASHVAHEKGWQRAVSLPLEMLQTV
jgi:hypothetical protein